MLNLKDKRNLLIFLPLFILLVVLPITSVKGYNFDIHWPTDDWIIVQPEEQGMSSSALSELYEYIEAMALDVHSVIVVRNGYIVSEEYLYNSQVRDVKEYSWGSTLHGQASTTKSLMSLLVGIALDKGYLNSVNQTLYEFFEEVWDPTYDNRKKNITIEQLLTHTSGLANHANNAYPSGSTVYTDCVEWALDDVPLVFDPGEDGSFEYSNDACNLLAAIINNVTSINASMFAKQYLFEPMGIVDEDWDFTQDSKGVNLGGWGFDCTPRIQAKIGMICLNNGTWNGTQLISSNWLREATSYKRDHWWLNQFPIKLYDYGYLFYISEEDGWYYSYGIGGQNIFVIPEYNITVGFTGWGLDSDLNNVDKYYKHMINTYILQFTTGGDTAELIPGFSFLVIIFIATIGTGVYIRIIKKKINYS